MKRSFLVLSLRDRDVFRVGDVLIQVYKKHGVLVRAIVAAPRNVSVERIVGMRDLDGAIAQWQSAASSHGGPAEGVSSNLTSAPERGMPGESTDGLSPHKKETT